MAVTFSKVIIKNASDVNLGSSTILMSSRADSSPKLSFATITDQGGTKHVQVGDYVTSDGSAEDFSQSNPPSSAQYTYAHDHPERDTFCVEQKIGFNSDITLQFGTTFFIEYEKLNVLGFIVDSESPDYLLKNNLEVSFGSGSSAATINFQVVDNKIRVDSENFPKVPRRENPVTIKFICKFNFSSEDFLQIIVQSMNSELAYMGYEYYGYSFYDEVLVENTYTVTFNSQGGSPVAPYTDVASGSTISAPTNPTKTGYDFGGWYKEDGCITPWDFDNDVVYVDTTLYAKWTIQTFSVTFDSDGGSQVSPYTGVEYGSKINEPSTPEKLENNFDGWYKDSEFETAWDFENDTVTEDITLYAKWVEWVKNRIFNPNAYKGENLKLVRASKTKGTFDIKRR